MYPFERFTERAKKVLTLAQEEAERSHHSYIGTEHLLLGLLREGDGVAGRVLNSMGIEIGTVRQVIESVLGRNERILIQQIVPTSRVKKVIEISFDEARRMGHHHVGTEHLLLGLLIEGEGVAAHVLQDLGVTTEKTRAEVERALASAGAEPHEFPAMHPLPSGFTPRQPPVRLGADALGELLASPHIAALFKARGLDVETLAQQVQNPPELVIRLRERKSAAATALAAAVEARDYDTAARLQNAHAGIAAQLDEAEREWLEHLAR